MMNVLSTLPPLFSFRPARSRAAPAADRHRVAAAKPGCRSRKAVKTRQLMGVPAHGAAALCMPGEKTGNKYAVSQYSAAFPQHQHRPYPAHPSRSRQIQTKRGIFSDDDDDSRREHKRSHCPGGCLECSVAANSIPPSPRHQHSAQLIRPSAASQGVAPKKPVLPRGIPPRGGGGQRLQKKYFAENNTSTALSVEPLLQRRRPTAGHRRSTSASRTPPPLARPRVKR